MVLLNSIFGSQTKPPEGYHEASKRGNLKRYIKKTEVGTREATCEDLSKLKMVPIFGYTKKNDTERFYSYFPVVSLYYGVAGMCNTISEVFTRIIKNDNSIIGNVSRKTDFDNKWILEDREIQKIELKAIHKLAVLAHSICIYIRSLITFLQLGILFAPFDFLVGYRKKA